MAGKNIDCISANQMPPCHPVPVKKSFDFKDYTEGADEDSEDFSGLLEQNGLVEADNEMHTVFQWVDAVTKLKMVTVVLTLPSGATNVKIFVGGEEGSGVTSEVIVKYPWSNRFIEPKVIFGNKSNKNSEYWLHPEAIAFARHIDSMRKNIMQTPQVTYKIVLPIPVQTQVGTYSYMISKFSPFESTDTKQGGKQFVLIIRLTGVMDRFVTKYEPVLEVYDSDDDKKVAASSTPTLTATPMPATTGFSNLHGTQNIAAGASAPTTNPVTANTTVGGSTVGPAATQIPCSPGQAMYGVGHDGRANHLFLPNKKTG